MDLNFWDKARSSKTVGIISAQAVSSFYAALSSRDLADADELMRILNEPLSKVDTANKGEVFIHQENDLWPIPILDPSEIYPIPAFTPTPQLPLFTEQLEPLTIKDRMFGISQTSEYLEMFKITENGIARSLNLPDMAQYLSLTVSAFSQKMLAPPILLIGETGVGKTVLNCHIIGIPLEQKDDPVTAQPYIKIHKDYKGTQLPNIGHGTEPGTKVFQLSSTKLESKLLLTADCPGFLDSRGAEADMINMASLRALGNQAGGFQGIVVVISADVFTANDQRMSNLRKFILDLSRWFDDLPKMIQDGSLLLIVNNKGDTSSQRLKVITRAKLSSYSDALKNQLQLAESSVKGSWTSMFSWQTSQEAKPASQSDIENQKILGFIDALNYAFDHVVIFPKFIGETTEVNASRAQLITALTGLRRFDASRLRFGDFHNAINKIKYLVLSITSHAHDKIKLKQDLTKTIQSLQKDIANINTEKDKTTLIKEKEDEIIKNLNESKPHQDKLNELLNDTSQIVLQQWTDIRPRGFWEWKAPRAPSSQIVTNSTKAYIDTDYKPINGWLSADSGLYDADDGKKIYQGYFNPKWWGKKDSSPNVYIYGPRQDAPSFSLVRKDSDDNIAVLAKKNFALEKDIEKIRDQKDGKERLPGLVKRLEEAEDQLEKIDNIIGDFKQLYMLAHMSLQMEAYFGFDFTEDEQSIKKQFLSICPINTGLVDTVANNNSSSSMRPILDTYRPPATSSSSSTSVNNNSTSSTSKIYNLT